MDVLYVCPHCGANHTFNPQEYEERFSWSDPHNPYQGEFIQCPVCFAIDRIPEKGISVYDENGPAVLFSPDGVFIFLFQSNGEVKQFI